MPGVAGPLVEHCWLFLLSSRTATSKVRCLLPHRGTHLPPKHGHLTRASDEQGLIQILSWTGGCPCGVVWTRNARQLLPRIPKTPARTHAAHSQALKHTLSFGPLPTFCDLTICNICLGSWRPSFRSHASSLVFFKHVFLHLRV